MHDVVFLKILLKGIGEHRADYGFVANSCLPTRHAIKHVLFKYHIREFIRARF